MLCTTVRDTSEIKIGHFLGIFDLENDLFLVDGYKGNRGDVSFLPPFTQELAQARRLNGILKQYRNPVSTIVFYLI